MGIVNCAVVGCTRNSRQLDKWNNLACEKHTGQLQKICGCEPPFRLYCFPGEKRYKDKRFKWVELLKRENIDKSEWVPSKSDRVCSEHFVDKIPTVSNPDPTLKLGYKKTKKNSFSNS